LNGFGGEFGQGSHEEENGQEKTLKHVAADLSPLRG
jgi:hypothetical protein